MNIVIGVVIVVGIGMLGIYAYFFFNSPHENIIIDESTQSQILASVAESSGMAGATAQVEKIPHNEEKFYEYKNTTRGFSLHYPQELSVKEHNEGDGTYTIVFENVTGEKSFQVFFTPYAGDMITPSRMARDIPSGKFTKPVEIIIGGNTRGLMFFSEGPLGRLREVWFLYGGFLYEITTHEDLDEWLSHIMTTWKFFK